MSTAAARLEVRHGLVVNAEAGLRVVLRVVRDGRRVATGGGRVGAGGRRAAVPADVGVTVGGGVTNGVICPP